MTAPASAGAPSAFGEWPSFLLVALVMAPCLALGANTAPLAAIAASMQLLTAGALVWKIGPILPVRFWTRAAPAMTAFAGAMAWAALGSWLADAGLISQLTPDAAPLELAKLAGVGACVLAGAVTGARRRHRARFADLLVWSGLLWVLLCVWMRQLDPLHVFGLDRAPPSLRFSGTLLNVNAAGCLFGMLALVGGARVLTLCAPRQDLHSRAQLLRLGGAIVAFVASAVACALTGSRAAVTLAAALILLLSVLELTGRSRRRVGLIAGAAAVGVAMLALSERFWSRLTSLDTDAHGRAWALAHYAGVALRAPLFGFGLGSFQTFNATALSARDARGIWDFGAAHDAPLQASIEGGWPFCALLALSIGLMAAERFRRRGPRAIRTSGGLRRGFIAAAILALLCSSVDIALDVPAVSAFSGVLLGLAWGPALADTEQHE